MIHHSHWKPSLNQTIPVEKGQTDNERNERTNEWSYENYQEGYRVVTNDLCNQLLTS